METVYLVWHMYTTRSGRDEDHLIGIYTTRRRAKAAILRVRDKPGFRRRPDNFEIFDHRLNRDGWTEGFLTPRASRLPKLLRPKS